MEFVKTTVKDKNCIEKTYKLSFSDVKPGNTGPTPGTKHEENSVSMKIAVNIYKLHVYRNLSF